MKVLSGPVDGARHANAYIRLLLQGLGEVVDLEPFTWRRALVGRHDVIHLHWVEHMLDNTGTGRRAWPKAMALALVVARSKVLGTKLVWTIHNEAPHERPRPAVRLGLAVWRRAVDGAVFLTEAGRAAHRGRRFPAMAVIRHGHYLPVVADGSDVTTRRCRPYLLTFGQLRAYKGLDRLVNVAVAAPLRHDVVIVGADQDGTQAPMLRRLAGDADDVVIDDRFVPDDELLALVRGSAGVVLPYRRMNNSGALLFALSAGARVLVPGTVTNREIAGLVGAGWVTCFEGELDADDLTRFADATPPSTAADLGAFDWDGVIAGHERLYRSLTTTAR